MDSLHEECGVMGVIGDSQASFLIYLGLYALQHRGQEACGIVTLNDSVQPPVTDSCKSLGLVSDQIKKSDLEQLKGHLGLGHVRYSTQGGSLTENIQPFIFRTSAFGTVSLAHNGNLTNGDLLRQELEQDGSIFVSTTDSEVLIHLLAKSKHTQLKDRIADLMGRIKGAYSLVMMAEGRLYGVRDPFGFRPLVLGHLGESWIFASETCALDLLGARFVREVEPGEIIRIDAHGPQSFFPKNLTKKSAACSFEPIYFARPDSVVSGESVYETRKRMGEILAAEYPASADLVMAIPDSGVPLALGYSRVSGLPLELALVRNHYVGRTFIEPYQENRDFGVRLKLNPVGDSLKGKSIVLLDDSVVRGTTSKKIVRMLREAGVREIHFRVGSPPITHSCFYGVSTPEREQLLAARHSVKEIRDLLGVDSLAYLSLEGLRKALLVGDRDKYCFACFNGDYPEEIFAPVTSQPADSLETTYCSDARK